MCVRQHKNIARWLISHRTGAFVPRMRFNCWGNPSRKNNRKRWQRKEKSESGILSFWRKSMWTVSWKTWSSGESRCFFFHLIEQPSMGWTVNRMTGDRSRIITKEQGTLRRNNRIGSAVSVWIFYGQSGFGAVIR